ncbi:hypothetical protein G7Y41_08690 [Schaalia sp. ZJ405]|uniref:hypothetical protein n=1 Tax=Schaalia sp. ZJ405 TaxID=2709403 RepID=UPI0013ED18C6|nr:hypothetical protein [Schaalia sp. ZJ405]QPK81101.1 hypothetical protein G7Y41_08690 [Schaalia sp. ZJ405]
MELSLDTTAYLNGEGTATQQELFQRAADRIVERWQSRYPNDTEPGELEAGIRDELVGAAMYCLGDATIEDLAASEQQARMGLEVSVDRLTGALIAADIDGLSKAELTRKTGLVRTTIYNRLGE